MARRVVVTGMGAITPVGNTVESFWESLKNGVNGIGEITRFDTAEFKAKMAAEVKNFDLTEYMDKKEERRMDLYCQYGMAAAIQAYRDSGLSEDNVDPYRFAVFAGSGIGGIITFEKECKKLFERGPSRVSPLLIPMMIANILPGNIAIKFGAKGSCLCHVSACATGTHTIGEAFRYIKSGGADVMITGSAEAAITPIGIAGFINMTALSTVNDPNRCSIPFDKDREGFVMGEGAGMLVLEELEHALARNAKIYAEVVGYGSTCDAYHITAPSPEGDGAIRAMREAIEEAEISPDEISYINAHGTGTPYNDLFETIAIKAVFGKKAYEIPVSSTKSMTGHLLGAAGSVEAIACVKALEEGFIPPTINLNNSDPELDLDYVPNKGRNADLTYTLSNSLGFGGHNGTIVLKKWQGK